MNGAAPTTRTCGACDRPFSGKAGRMAEGKPLCPTCGNRLRPKVACSECGRLTARPRRRTPDGDLICEGCLCRDTHATCKVCRRHRPAVVRDDDGAATCAGCAAAEPATRTCPDCRAKVAGRGAAPCDACSLKRLIARRAADCAALVEPPWARALFVTFGEWPDLPRNRNAVAKRMDGYAGCFAAIGKGCAGPGEITQTRLLALLGNEEMRRNLLVIRFLAGHLALAWEPATAEDAAERRRIEATLAANAGQPWAGDLQAYHAHLAAADIRLKTVRAYLAAAAGLLTEAGVTQAAASEQAHIQRRLRRKPGHRANLHRFTSWLPSVGGRSHDIGAKRKPNPRQRERNVLRRAQRLIEALDVVTDARRGRALLAAAISVLHQLPLAKVLALRRDDVTVAADHGVLWPAGDGIVLAAPLARCFARFTAVTGQYAFPGRNGAQPLSTDAVTYHVGRLAGGDGPCD